MINDIATIHVVDYGEDIFNENKIYPACLPSSSTARQSSERAYRIHSGWSTPPSLSFIQKYVPFYTQYYKDFLKQWHYNMELTECRDPTQNDLFNVPIQFPSDTYYPPGLVCAKEHQRQFCPTSGESGSPLMNEKSGRFEVDGILSFIKGCRMFVFNEVEPSSEQFSSWNSLDQRSNNPSVYTKLNCFLPWIAQQYNLGKPH